MKRNFTEFVFVQGNGVPGAEVVKCKKKNNNKKQLNQTHSNSWEQ